MMSHDMQNIHHVFLQVTRENGLYEDIMIGLSVRGKNISNLQEHINYTISLSSGINVTTTLPSTISFLALCSFIVNRRILVWQENQTLSCVFLNFSTMSE